MTPDLSNDFSPLTLIIIINLLLKWLFVELLRIYLITFVMVWVIIIKFTYIYMES